jgi:ABC-2 type transport system ATP-binding protein
MSQALLGNPPVAVLDEPMAGLDPLNVLEMRDALRDYAQERAVLVSTHMLPDARLLCDRVIVMSRGVVVYDGSTAGMATESGGRVRVRLRLRGESANGRVPKLVEGTTLVHQQAMDSGYVMVVDGDSDARVGDLVRQLALDDWAVLSVEPTMDVLEEAFKRAVLGTGEPAEGRAAQAGGPAPEGAA